MLNFHVPYHTFHKYGYRMKILKSDELEEVAAVDLNLNLIIAEFLLKDNTCYERQEFFHNGCEVQFTIYIQKSRVLLLKEILKKGDAVDDLMAIS